MKISCAGWWILFALVNWFIAGMVAGTWLARPDQILWLIPLVAFLLFPVIFMPRGGFYITPIK